MIEKYFNKDLCERFQHLRLTISNKAWESDDYFISLLLDSYEEYKEFICKYKKLKFKYKLLRSKFKVFYLFNKLLYLN